LAADAKLQEAVLAYSREPEPRNRSKVREAVRALNEILPWPDHQEQSPGRLRMFALMPADLHWPDPMWGETLFHQVH
jgi:hypothetical protein